MSLSLAIRIARARPLFAKRGTGTIGRMAAVLSDNRLAWIVVNQPGRSHPLQARYATHSDRVWLHAEVDCLRQAINYFTGIQGVRRDNLSAIDLSGFTMSVARVLADGTPSLAKPCAGYMAAIKRFKIEKVVWTE